MGKLDAWFIPVTQGKMAACIEEVLETPWDRQQLRNYVAERFSFEVVTRKLLEMYGSVRRDS